MRMKSSIHARLYRKVGDIKNTLDAAKIRKSVSGDIVYEAPKRMGVQVLKSIDAPKINIPNPIQLREESLYMKALKNLPTGGEYAEYHHLISAILIKLLMPPLENPIVE